jgi:hypothetical protein
MDTDHSGLNKFSGKDDECFTLLLPEIFRMVKNGPETVARRYREGNNPREKVGNVHWIVPQTMNSLFTGRSELIDRIKSTLRIEGNVYVTQQRRLVITGMGGVGKSEVCLKAINLMRDEYVSPAFDIMHTPE